MSRLFKWDNGRQKGGYSKMLLAELKWPNPFDMYLIYFPKGSEAKCHKDPMPDKKHFRF